MALRIISNYLHLPRKMYQIIDALATMPRFIMANSVADAGIPSGNWTGYTGTSNLHRSSSLQIFSGSIAEPNRNQSAGAFR
jgi:hypothetical protein